jgi:hypothetical protein
MMYAIVSTAIFLILAIIWSRSDWGNLFIKLVFAGLGVWGLVASNAIRLNL